MKTRVSCLEFWAEEADPIYGTWNLGFQLSLTCVALLLGRWTVGVWLWRMGDRDA